MGWVTTRKSLVTCAIKARKDNCYLDNDYPWNGLEQVVKCSKFVLAQRFFSKYLEWVYRASTRFR
jgi:hypothetical protein